MKRDARARGLIGSYRVLPTALKHDTDSGRSPPAISASRDLGFVEPTRNLAQLQPAFAHALDLAQNILLVGQRHQLALAVLVALVAQLVAVRRRPESRTPCAFMCCSASRVRSEISSRSYWL